MIQATIVPSSLEDSPIPVTFTFFMVKFIAYFRRKRPEHPERGRRTRGVVKMCNFQPVSRSVSETALVTYALSTGIKIIDLG